ncbi:MAG: MATE family efflux transporter [Gammaproteobacteria bacterium]|nr:MATE family efflux transporter [Gammaproteobacteria bacterium]NNF49374.1 MATE family efflux transporter [Woeseiaceae bacterium]MBT8093553.1 MATE family efflux transporter [Gammaproteobacteria bacterium]MBT8106483.1 MATE family efflux transporter [Gammaproteobacteria bacterium]NNK26498.1 MATE family efflux transporter [Woeseiaceae bacterium]
MFDEHSTGGPRVSERTTALRRARLFLAEALRDNDEDFTSGPIGRALGLLAIPMMLEMAMESIFAVVDIAFVSRLGTDAVAAVGITEALITVLYAAAIGLGMGITAMVSRRIGAGDAQGAAEVTGQSIWIGVLMSVGVGVLGVMFARDLLVLMGASDSVIEQGTGFTTVLLGGSFSIIFLFLLNAAFRGAGDATVALRSLWIANGCNIVLDPCFIFGLGPFPEMGVTGAAVATTIGRGIGVAYQLWYLLRGSGRLAFATRHLRFIPSLAWRLLRISLGGIGQFLIATASWIGVMRIVAMFGSPAIAAFTIALRAMEFIYLPAWGLGNAAATLVGQNLGAGRPDRAERSAWQASKYNAIFMGVTAVFLIVFAAVITGWFTNDAEVLRIGTHCMRILALGFPLYAVGMVVVQAMNGAGDTETPMTLNLVSFWLVQIPLAFMLATRTALGPEGAFIAIVLSESLLTVLSVVVFRRGGWKTHEA